MATETNTNEPVSTTETPVVGTTDAPTTPAPVVEPSHTANNDTTKEAPAKAAETTQNTPDTNIVTTTPVADLAPQPVTSGPTNPQVDDAIVNETTNDDVVAAWPTKKNAQGVHQVHIDSNGQIEGLPKSQQPKTTK